MKSRSEIPQPPTKCPRQAFSLIELLVAMSMIFCIVTLTGTTFFLLMRSEKLVAQSFVTERATTRLSQLFRDDVHQSTTGSIVDASSNAANELVLGDGQTVRIRYRVTKHGVARLTVENDEIVARDDFRLPDCQAVFSSGTGTESAMRTLTIERPGLAVTRYSRGPRTPRHLEIYAYLARRPATVPAATAVSSSVNVDPAKEEQ